jgi:hypothetical protein
MNIFLTLGIGIGVHHFVYDLFKGGQGKGLYLHGVLLLEGTGLEVSILPRLFAVGDGAEDE